MSNDCISRQAALDAVYNIVRTDNWKAAVTMVIMDLPSAQPDLQPTCNQLATDTISRKVAIDELIAMREHIDARMSVIGCTAYEMAIEALREPERKTGHWLVKQDHNGSTYGECSQCHSIQYAGHTPYCPYCGSHNGGGTE